MEGPVSWPQLLFAGMLVVSSFGAAAWVLLKLTDILVRLEKLATKEDLSAAKTAIYTRMDLQWQNYTLLHDDLSTRVRDLEIRAGPTNGRGRMSPS